MAARDFLRSLDAALQTALQQGLGKTGLSFPETCSQPDDAELAAIVARLETFFTMINEAYRYAEGLAKGELQVQAARNNIFAMPLKALQANLTHLTWQANQVAAGDLNQQVHFLGDFSTSFNRMIGALREKEALEQQLKTITDVLGEGVYLVDAADRLVFINPEAEKELGYSFAELAGQPVHKLIHRQGPDGSAFPHESSPLYLAIREGKDYNDNDAVLTCKSGRLMPVSLSCRPVIANEAANGAVIAFRDISEQKKTQEALQMINELLEKQATTDALTGAHNRMKLNRLLEVEIERAKRYRTPLSVILFDVDKFKGINDDFGHLAGDAVLKELAATVSSDIRASDIFARWGGEEFMVVAPERDLEQGLQFAEKLRVAVEQHQFSIDRSVTASFGVASFSSDDTSSSLTNRADQALYRAKHNGRNRVEAEKNREQN